MAVTVAPLTTTVMNALDPVHAGLASGVNNAVSRAAGLLAIALLGIVLQRAYDAELERRIAAARLPAALRLQLATQRGKLAAPALPPSTAPAERARVEDAVAGAFVHGFRWVMGISALLALGGAGCAWAMLGRRRTR
jgi:tetrahydromethanopterin S-methyltransferase subunit B